jgi:penicillin-binding protein 2
MREQQQISSTRLEQWRKIVLYAIMGIVFLILMGRLFTLQIIEGGEYLAQAEENRTDTISIQTPRGIIYDRNGIVLAQNIASYNVVITPADLPDDTGAIQEVFRKLSQIIDMPVNKGDTDEETVRNFSPCVTDIGIAQIVVIGDTNAPYTPIQIKCDVDETVAKIIQEKSSDLPGVGIEISPIRDYPTGSLTSEIVGFLGPIPAIYEEEYKEKGFVTKRDKVGYAGIEAYLDDILLGTPGKRVVEVDVAGKVIRDLEPPIEETPGRNVKLTIDTRLQLAAKTALTTEIDYWNKYLNTIRSANGVVIAMNPKTGEILALVSYPTFENNRMARMIPAYYYDQLYRDPNRPLFNHAISAEHPPGSVFKLAAAIGALNERVVTPEKTLNCPGKISIIQKYYENDPGKAREYVCYQETGHGDLDFLHGVAQSCDVYFYKIGGGYENEVSGGGLGIWRLAEYARALGYGQKLGIELPGEEEGLIPDPTWKRITIGENWSTGDTYIATIGQGYVLSTALQVLESVAIVANDGVAMKPTLVKEILDGEGHVITPFTPVQLWDITKDPLIREFDENNNAILKLDENGDPIPVLDENGQQLVDDYGNLVYEYEKKTVEPWVIQKLQEGMRLVVTEGTAAKEFNRTPVLTIASAGKTGTAEYCDNVAQAKNLCQPGSWPTHAWYIGYAPYEDPEIAVVAFVYNGGEGASVAAPIVKKVLSSYFDLKVIDSTEGTQP